MRAGIAESLRAFRIPPMRAGDGETRLRRNARRRLYLDEANERALGRLYDRWLERVGIAAFGEPLPHGPERPDTEGDADPGDPRQGARTGTHEDARGKHTDGAASAPDPPPSAIRVVPIPEADDVAGEAAGVGAGVSDAPAQAADPPAPASLASVAVVAAALSGAASGELVARLSALLAERSEAGETTAAPPTGERLSELVGVLAAAGAAGWSAERLEEVIGRALASPRPPAERREAFLAHLEAARAAAAAARGQAA